MPSSGTPAGTWLNKCIEGVAHAQEACAPLSMTSVLIGKPPSIQNVNEFLAHARANAGIKFKRAPYQGEALAILAGQVDATVVVPGSDREIAVLNGGGRGHHARGRAQSLRPMPRGLP